MKPETGHLTNIFSDHPQSRFIFFFFKFVFYFIIFKNLDSLDTGINRNHLRLKSEPGGQLSCRRHGIQGISVPILISRKKICYDILKKKKKGVGANRLSLLFVFFSLSIYGEHIHHLYVDTSLRIYKVF